MGKLKLLILYLAVFCVLVPAPLRTEAHAVLTASDPAPGSSRMDSPERVLLRFNERIEGAPLVLQVRDRTGQVIADRRPVLEAEGRELSLPLPPLEDGMYTVSYRVISADGHPVDGSYVFVVGASGGTEPTFPSGSSGGSGHDHTHGSGGGSKWLMFALRIASTAGMVGFCGWLFWSGHTPAASATAAVVSRNESWRAALLSLFVVTQLTFVGFCFAQLLPESSGWGEIRTFATGTTIGRSLLAVLVLALVSPFLTGRNRLLDAGWITSVFTAKSLNGHAAATEIPWISVPSQVIHLFASCIWAGGLCYLLAHLIRDRNHADAFLPLFARWALFALLAVSVTGLVNMLLILPDQEALFRSDWGRWLLVKLALVAAVGVTALLIRAALRKRSLPVTGIRVDFGLMLAIVGIAAIFTAMSPVPENRPLQWQERTASGFVTIGLIPGGPGINRIHVGMEPEGLGDAPESVLIQLKPLDRKDIPPIEVQLAEKQDETEQFRFDSEGPFLPFSGRWEIAVRIMSEKDDETVIRKHFSYY